MGHRDLLVTHTLSEAEYHGCRPHPRRSVRRASGFLLTALSNARANTYSSLLSGVRASDKALTFPRTHWFHSRRDPPRAFSQRRRLPRYSDSNLRRLPQPNPRSCPTTLAYVAGVSLATNRVETVVLAVWLSVAPQATRNATGTTSVFRQYLGEPITTKTTNGSLLDNVSALSDARTPESNEE